MGRPKGKKSGYTFRTKEEKFKIIEPILKGEISASQLGKELGISGGLLRNWVIDYINGGIEALENKKKPGNPLAALHASKSLTNEQRLQLENMKLRIENERLKKGYTKEEVDRIKKSLGKNTK